MTKSNIMVISEPEDHGKGVLMMRSKKKRKRKARNKQSKCLYGQWGRWNDTRFNPDLSLELGGAEYFILNYFQIIKLFPKWACVLRYNRKSTREP